MIIIYKNGVKSNSSFNPCFPAVAYPQCVHEMVHDFGHPKLI